MNIDVVINNLQYNFVNSIVENVESYFKIYDLSVKVIFESYNDEGELCLILDTTDSNYRFRLIRCYDDECFIRSYYDERYEEEFKNLESALQYLVKYLKNEDEENEK